jgi:hypothetical protein
MRYLMGHTWRTEEPWLLDNEQLAASLAAAIVITAKAYNNAAIFLFCLFHHCTECMAHRRPIVPITIHFHEVNQVGLLNSQYRMQLWLPHSLIGHAMVFARVCTGF